MKLTWTRRKKKALITIPTAEEIRANLFEHAAHLGQPMIPGQLEFLRLMDERVSKYIAYRAGIGAGKSWIGSHYALEMAARNPTARGFIAANTYPQLSQTTLSTLYEVAAIYGVPIHPRTPEAAAKKKALYLWNRVEVLCRSAEKGGYKLWDGFKCGWFWLDEPKDMEQAAYRTATERHRDNRADVLQGWMTASPAFNWWGEIEEDPDVTVVRADTRENLFNPDGYVQTLLSKMSPEMVKQQIEGLVINTSTGRCYPNFSRVENGGQFAAADGKQFIGIDFNVDPGMHAYLIEVRGELVFVLDEIFIRNGDTPQLAKELERRYGTGIPLIPDAAGGQRHTTGTSDHRILQEAGFRLQNRPANPPIKDRLNAVNGRILNALGERRLFIDDKCRLLRQDLEGCTWEIMTRSGYHGPLTHPGAAIGYTIERQFPMMAGGFAVRLPKMY